MDMQRTSVRYTFINPNKDDRAIERTLRQMILEKLSAKSNFSGQLPG